MSSSLAIERDNIRKLFPDTFNQAKKSRIKGQIIFFLILIYLIIGFFYFRCCGYSKKMEATKCGDVCFRHIRSQRSCYYEMGKS